MDKWRNKLKAVTISEGSLLPPTRRISSINPPPPLLDKRRTKKWSIDGFFKKVSSILDAQSSSSSLDDLSEAQKRRLKGKSKGIERASGYAYKTGEAIDHPSPVVATLSSVQQQQQRGPTIASSSTEADHANANTTSPTMDLLEVRLAGSNSHSRSSDGSLDGKRVRKDRVKARVEARRDQLCNGDSSMDESSNEELIQANKSALNNGLTLQQKQILDGGKRRSRASRTERYLKRMCNGNGSKANGTSSQKVADSRNLEGRGVKQEEFRPIERVPRTEFPQDITGISNGDGLYCPPHYDNGLPNDNFYTRQADIGVNPLVQQTLQYFSEFDRSMAAAVQHKTRKAYPGHHHQQQQQQQLHRRSHKPQAQPCISNETSVPETHSSNIPPKPPSRDHRSRILVNGSSLDKYQQMLRYVQKTPNYSSALSQQLPQQFDKENGYDKDTRSALHSPNTEVRNINEGRCYSTSPCPTMHKYQLPLSSPTRSPFRDALNATATGAGTSFIERNQSPLLDVNKTKFVDQTSSRFTPTLQSNDIENSNYVPLKNVEVEKPNERRSYKNLEEALCELEAIYNSLQLGDEELLERAEKRTMEEFHYKGFTTSPVGFDNEDSSSRRKTWGDPALGNFKEEPEIPDRLKDDMAYRRMHPKERPSSVDGQSSLSSISYLMTSPIPSRREMRYIDPKRKPRRKEPDVTLDDVVFRSMQYANNTLKVVEPQPPFGIPLGPITTATDSDYLHTNPTKLERARSPYIPCVEPDLVTDDLAFRNLRKDAQPSSRQPSPCLLNNSANNFGYKKKRAVRSLSANLYGLINKPADHNPFELEFDDDQATGDEVFEEFCNAVLLPIRFVKRIGRRTSDPEVMSLGWQNGSWAKLDVNKNQSKEDVGKKETERLQLTDQSSDVDLSNRSCDESSDDRIRPQDRLMLGGTDGNYKGSDKGSSYLSSSCSSPPPPPPRRVAEPVTEQEISVYKKLCQDLENLVQLTKGIDDAPVPSERIAANLTVKVPVAIVELGTPQKLESIVTTSSTLESVTSKKSSVADKAEIIDSKNDSVKCISGDDGMRMKYEEKKMAEIEAETSSIKREISTILDSLKSLREDSNLSSSSFSEEKTKEDAKEDKAKREATKRDKDFNEITKEICDLVAGDKEVTKPTLKQIEKEKEADEEEERKDRLDDNVFFRNVHLAKLNGDWKESTPNGALVVNRRTSLSGNDTGNWEGMNKCNHKYNSMPAKTSSLLPFRHYGSKRKSNNRKSMCSVS